MFIPCLYHLECFPKRINIGWEVIVSEPKFTSDGVKAAFRQKFPKVQYLIPSYPWMLMGEELLSAI